MLRKRLDSRIHRGGAVGLLIGGQQFCHPGREGSLYLIGEVFILQSGQILFIRKVCIKQIRRDTLRDKGLGGSDEHDLLSCKAVSGGGQL